ncbi:MULTISPECIES: Flp family type IVb pilin [unclassified Pseudomonas]|uniref:Flp family type IVb pilin n=1 Tax=unclassified Pseudomonas TaxID=196821 RepID=UPI002AC973F3|nr:MULTISPECIES: Flp family type IVb pilin [unclassified Pseudomonas]MEB0041637.1 Flp family type IVb pilin [Pseudomonas sp. MH10]MEB0121987.1 Flp family type IVb pilin [Pseudomonas sp. CCI1.2]WPX61950.1 Flp family type IVb pilin [Pseudomonas sp. MH10]
MSLNYMMLRFKLFLEDKEAASAIEYAIVAAMVAVIAVAFIAPVGAEVKIIFNKVLVGLGGTAL